MESFVKVAPCSQFPLQNLPYGVFKPAAGGPARPGVAIGDCVVDLSILSDAGLFKGPLLSASDCFSQVCFATHGHHGVYVHFHTRVYVPSCLLVCCLLRHGVLLLANGWGGGFNLCVSQICVLGSPKVCGLIVGTSNYTGNVQYESWWIDLAISKFHHLQLACFVIGMYSLSYCSSGHPTPGIDQST